MDSSRSVRIEVRLLKKHYVTIFVETEENAIKIGNVFNEIGYDTEFGEDKDFDCN